MKEEQASFASGRHALIGQGSNEEVVLFAVVFVFLVSSVPRLVLNLYEVFVISQIRNACFRLPGWVLVMTRDASRRNLNRIF